MPNISHDPWGCRVNNPGGLTLYNLINNKKFKVFAPPGPTYWPSSSKKENQIRVLDISVTIIPNNLFYTTKSILDLNSDYFFVLPTLTPPLSKWFYLLYLSVNS